MANDNLLLPSPGKHIRLRGVRQHNLKGWDLDLPLDRWITVTGVSGSGKSSLAMDVLYAEGQRRYVETFSPYARQFLERMDRPHVEEVRSIPPALAIEGSHPVRTSRSTVGTMTELTDFLKLLFARMANPFCPGCGVEIQRTTPETLWVESGIWPQEGPWYIVFPLPVEGRDPEEIRAGLLRMGFSRFWDSMGARPLEEWNGESPEGEILVLVDRYAPSPEGRGRFVDSVEAAFRYGKGRMEIHFPDGRAGRWSNQWECAVCGETVREPSPNLFSFNSAVGACPVCRGFGRIIDIDPDLIVPEPARSIEKGAIRPFSVSAARNEFRDLLAFCRKRAIPTHVSWSRLEEGQRNAIFDGDEEYYGIRGFFRWLEEKSYRMHVRVFLSRFRAYLPCPSCSGARLRPEALHWRVLGKTLPEIWKDDVNSTLDFFQELERTSGENPVGRMLLGEIRARLAYLRNVGLGYLTLDRSSRTLSGGEVERVLLTRALGSRLVNTLFVMDEPSIGLHPRDTERLARAVRNLVSQGNTAVIVEHDPDLIRHSDLVVDLGPAAGRQGGEIIHCGSPATAGEVKESLTGQYLAGNRTIPLPAERKSVDPQRVLLLRGVRENNLKGIDVRIPLGLLVCITGVSGSGKSTLLIDVLHRATLRAKGLPGERPGLHTALEGAEGIDRVELVDQSSLGRTSRANPATYLKAWDGVRKVFAAHPASRERRWGPGMFSFNVPGGRCEACRGEGFIRVEMQFLSDVFLRCPDCGGRRFLGDVLQVLHKGRSIADVLEMTVDESCVLFQDYPAVSRALAPLQKMGLGYLTMGQPISTLSGGEAQRLKLARFLGDAPGRTLFLLDEPTTGLHLEDVRTLLEVLYGLVDRGHTVVVVEHHLEVIKCADHVIDLGPEGGDKGGWIVVEGRPEKIASHPQSHTGRYLGPALGMDIQGPGQKMGDLAPLVPEKNPRGDGPRTPSPSDPPVEEGGAPGSFPSLGERSILVAGARQHNLKDLSLRIPRDRIVAITGVSGSGKSTLAFDILFSEGQRRYLESLPAYVRQYLRVLDRPDVDLVAGIPPTVAIEQRTARAGRRSTVATLTEIYHFLRLMFARLGIQHCPTCEIPISVGGVDGVLRGVLEHFSGRKILVLAPKVVGRKGLHRKVMEQAQRNGLERVRVDGRFFAAGEAPRLDRFREHHIEWVVGETLVERGEGEDPLRSLVEAALFHGDGAMRVLDSSGLERTYSNKRQCPQCGTGFGELDPRHFSFNSPMGACTRCEGLGAVSRGPEEIPCPECSGERLAPKGRAVKVLGLRMADVNGMTVSNATRYWGEATFPEPWRPVSQPLQREILSRLETLERLGVGYLSLDRSADTLSGGESQRIRLAAQLGSNLRGVCYVLDEPTIGLHPRDHHLLLESLRLLRDRGNTVVVVEHDEETIRGADWVIDLGPGAGRDGGSLVAEGTWSELRKSGHSPTVNRLDETAHRRLRSRGRPPRDGAWIRVRGAAHHNLKGVDVAIPLGTLTCVTGVSGSGKSSLVQDVLYRGLVRCLRGGDDGNGQPPGIHEGIEGWERLEKVLEVDHSPIGRTPRSTPATYVKVWDEIRRLFAGLPEARSRGYSPSRFSFNVAAGRCPACEGQGVVRREMNFLPDVYVACDGCEGARFNRETLSVTYRGRHIGQVLDMTVEEALSFFQPIPRLRRPLQVLQDLGLGYLTLGQASPTLSGGEAQRVKLVQELSRASRGRNLYVLDEPTTGLHIADVEKLLETLQRLVDRGDTVVVVEHQMDVIAAADHIIDLGPEGGEGGGSIVAQGPPEEILRAQKPSHTAKWLKRFLRGSGNGQIFPLSSPHPGHGPAP